MHICEAISKHRNKLDKDDPYDELLKEADVLQPHLYNIEFTVSENEKDRLRKVLIELEIVQ